MRRIIPLDNIDIVIREAENPRQLKDLDGVGAYCPSGYFGQLSIDSDHASFGKSSKKLIEKSLIHELHHADRGQSVVKIDNSFF